MTRFSFFLTAALVALMPLQAQAYIGPGLGLGAIAVTVAVVLGVLLLIGGFIWFPLKRMLKRNKAQGASGPSDK